MPEDTAQRLAELRQAAWAIRLDYMPLVREALRTREFLPPEAMKTIEAVDRQAREPNITPGGVAILNLTGVIRPQGSFFSMLFGLGGGGLKSFRQELRELVGNADVKAILLNIDSPGGLSDLVMETAAELREAASEKPITAIANTMACSAAYWIGCQANEFVVTPSGSAGSVGVYAVHDDYSAALEMAGIKPTYITAGKFKAEANPDEPLSDTAREHLQEMVDDCYADFIADVAIGRGVTEDAVKSGFGEGRSLTARAAIGAGIADRIATIEEVAADLANGGGSTRANIVRGAKDPAPKAEDPPAEEEEETPEPEPDPPPADPEPVADPPADDDEDDETVVDEASLARDLLDLELA